MSGLGIRLYTDEDVDPRVAEQLIRAGYDVLSCRVAGNHNQHRSDAWQLEFAVSQQRAILARNVVDYVALERRWRLENREHFGIVLIPRRMALGELIRRVALHLDTYTPEQHYNTVLFLTE